MPAPRSLGMRDQPTNLEGSGSWGRPGRVFDQRGEIALFPAVPEPRSSYRAVLALDAGAVEAQGGHSVDGPLDVEDTLIASLARLRLGQVSSLKSDWLDLTDWYQDLLRGHQLGTVLREQA